MNSKDFSYYISSFFSQYLPNHTGYSYNTIQSYRDTFIILIRYINDELNIPSNRINFKLLSRKVVEDFLLWLEEKKKCSISTRNQRLSGIHSFFKYLAREVPEHLDLCTDILSIKSKKTQINVVNYLSVEAIKTLLSTPNIKTKAGRRDLTLITLIYDTGARVSEIIELKNTQIRIKSPATIQLIGKGNKARIIPIMPETAKILELYLKENGIDNAEYSDYIFKNKCREKLTRAGATYILKKYVEQAKKIEPTEFIINVSPHSLRHSKAMHLLEGGVNLIYIRDFLGHVSVITTERYAKANPEIKRKHIEEASKCVLNENKYSIEDKDELLDWLKNNI